MPETIAVPKAAERGSPQTAERPRVAFVTNLIPPYHKPVLDNLARHYRHFRILLSTPMERNRPWQVEWDGLEVVLQKTITLNGLWHHPKGFSEPLYVHVPVDTIAQFRRFQPDVIISGEMGARTLLAAAYRFWRRDVRLIVWAEVAESTDNGRGKLRRALRKMLHPFVDAFLVTGESGSRYLRSLGIGQERLFKIAYTTNVRPFAQINLSREAAYERRLLYVGQLIERKGLLPFLGILRRWASSHPSHELELTFVGDGPERENLERFATPPNLKLTFVGNVSYTDLPAVYAQAGVFVFPTLADTWGVVVNEAMAAGLPVLGSVYGQAVAELVNDGENGWTFRPDLEEEVWQAIDRCLVTSTESLDGMRVKARQASIHLTTEYLAETIQSVIDLVWTQSPRRARHEAL